MVPIAVRQRPLWIGSIVNRVLLFVIFLCYLLAAVVCSTHYTLRPYAVDRRSGPRDGVLIFCSSSDGGSIVNHCCSGGLHCADPPGGVFS